MKTTVNKFDFVEAFRDTQYMNNFSPVGLGALFDYLEQYEEDCDTEIELDIVAIACDYSEYTSAGEAASNYFDYEGMIYDENGDETMTAEEVESSAVEYLQERTTLIEFDDGTIDGRGVIIANF